MSSCLRVEKKLTLLECSLFSEVLCRPPVTLTVTRADGQSRLAVTGEEIEAESEGFAQGQESFRGACWEPL